MRFPAGQRFRALATTTALLVAVVTGGGLTAAREADLLGRPGADLPVTGGALRLDLRAWEIRTVQLQREGP